MKNEKLPQNRDKQTLYIVGLIVALIVLAVTSVMARAHTLTGWELTVFHKINGWNAPEWVTSQIAKPISDAAWGLVGVVGLFLLIPKFTRFAWRFASVVGGAFVVSFVLEHIVKRERPVGLTHDLTLRAAQGGFGFPSGHVMTVTVLGLVMARFVSWPWRIAIGLFIFAEVWSRIYLGVHAPLDVIGGFALGTAAVCFVQLLPKKLKDLLRIS